MPSEGQNPLIPSTNAPVHELSENALRSRVEQAAEAALADHSYVSAIDVLCGMRLLQPTHVDAWRKGRIDFLESIIQGSLGRISTSM